jgi:hypothetical protein
VSSGFAARVDDALLGSCCLGDHRVTVVMGRWEAEMSFVVAAPEQVQAAAHDLAGIRALLAGATASAAVPTTAVAAAAQDGVSGRGRGSSRRCRRPGCRRFRRRSRTSAFWCPRACRLRRWRTPCARGPANCWKTLSCPASAPGPQIGEDRMSLTFALRFRAPDRTLTEADANAARDAAARRAAEAVGVVLRA